MKVAVLLGGDSAEREVSLASGQAVCEALAQAGIEHIAFDPSERALSELLAENITLALIMLHGRGGEDGTVQGALEYLKIPYTGSGVLGSALAMDKIHTKEIWRSQGLPTPRFARIKAPLTAAQAADKIQDIGPVLMVKPAREGSSIGMAKVDEPSALATAVEHALTLDDEVLLERYVQGQEYTVSILGDGALPSIRMSTPHDFYDYAAKYQDNTTEYFCPSGLNDADEARIGELALAAFTGVSATGWGRVDIMRSEDGAFQLLEVNTVPGMTAKSLVPKAAAQAGMDFGSLVRAIIATV
jgi:D-alanine-D-alanine ligase